MCSVLCQFFIRERRRHDPCEHFWKFINNLLSHVMVTVRL